MNWHARLAEHRAEKNLRGPDRAVPKVPKAPFVTFGTEQDGHPEKIAAPPDPADNRQLRTDLLALADRLGLDRALVHRLTTADVDACTGLPEGILRAYLSGIG